MERAWRDELREQVGLNRSLITLLVGNVYDYEETDAGETFPVWEIAGQLLVRAGFFPLYYDELDGFKLCPSVPVTEELEPQVWRLFGEDPESYVPAGGQRLETYNAGRIAEGLEPVPPQSAKEEFEAFRTKALKWLFFYQNQEHPEFDAAQLEALARYRVLDRKLDTFPEMVASLSHGFLTGAREAIEGTLTNVAEFGLTLRPGYIIRNSHTLVGTAAVGAGGPQTNAFVFLDWAVRFGLTQPGTFVFCSPQASLLDADLRAQGNVGLVQVPRPGLYEISAALETREDAVQEQVDRSARAMVGMPFARVRRLPMGDPVALRAAAAEEVNRRFDGTLKVVLPGTGFEHLHLEPETLKYLRAVGKALREGRRKLVPQGILEAGPPGTAKSATARALAKEFDVPFYRLGNLYNMFVGESERRTEQVIDFLGGLEMGVLFQDEIDQASVARDRRFDGDSGVTSRVQGQIMEFLADPAIMGRILFICATNRPDRMDDAMKRSGRISGHLCFAMPDMDAALNIFMLKARQHEIELPAGLDLEQIWKDAGFFATSVPMLCGADIEQLLLNANFHACAMREADRLSNDDIVAVTATFRPSVLPRIAEEHEILAVLTASDKKFWPKRYQTQTDAQLRSKLNELRQRQEG